MMTTRTRRRYTDVYHLGGTYLSYRDGAISNTINYESMIGRREVTVDERHAWPARNIGRVTRDVGGPFLSVKSALTCDWDLYKVYHLGSHGGTNYAYDGHVWPSYPSLTQRWVGDPSNYSEAAFLIDHDPLHTEGDLEVEGTRAIAATIPTNSSADTAVGVAELFREGLPSLIGSTVLRDRIGFLRSLGSEYLNYEFGWKPLLSDLRSLAQSIDESEKLLAQLARDSGRNVRRRYSFPAEREAVYTTGSGGLSPALSSLISGISHQQTTMTFHKSWFSGCYTYHYDPADLTEASRIATQARLLLGLKIDPEVLWNLAPWSWLVDWFVNIGPVLHNLSAFGQDGLVLRYGYLMHHSTRRVERVWPNVGLPRGGDFPVGARHAAISLETKRRIRATPYGFGLAVSSFTWRQWAILGALGLTKTPGVL
jgi:hypothetical protein